jgi:hypothetical protein
MKRKYKIINNIFWKGFAFENKNPFKAKTCYVLVEVLESFYRIKR